MELNKIRTEIDAVDDKLTEILLNRLNLVVQVAAAKKAEGLPIADLKRESAILDRILQGKNDSERMFLTEVFLSIFKACKAYQAAVMEHGNE